MGGIASAIIIPPAGSGLDRVAPGSSGAEASRRVSAVSAIVPRRDDGSNRQTGFRPDDGARSRGRDNRQVRQLAIRPDYNSGSAQRSDLITLDGPRTQSAGLQGFGGARFASIQFLAQVIGQAEDSSGGARAFHPDGAALGSDAYRRAGAAPPHYSEQPAVFRVAI